MYIKKIVLGLLVFVMMTNVFSQVITRNEIDEFEGVRIIQTSWETVLMKTFQTIYIRFKSVDTLKGMQLAWVHPDEIKAVEDGEKKVIVKLKNGETINFNNLNYVISSKGGGSHSFVAGGSANGLTLSLFSKDIDKLANEHIAKVRIYTTKSYFDFDVKPKRAEIIKRAFLMLSIEVLKNKK